MSPPLFSEETTFDSILATVEPRYNEVATHGLAKVFRYNEISLNRGIFPYVLLLLG